MANDDDYDFSGVSQPGPFDVEASVLSQWRAQNDDEEDDDYSYFWPEQLPYDIVEKLREINKVHQEDETPIESDRPRKITFNSRVSMRAISMRRIPPPAENNDNEPFDLSKYDTDESVDDGETSINVPAEVAKPAAAVDVPQSPARPLPVPTTSSVRGPTAAAAAARPTVPQKQHFTNKTAVSRVGQGQARSAGGLATGGFTEKAGTGAARRGFSECQNFQLPNGLASDRLSVLSLTDDDDDDDCVVGPVSSDTGYSSASAAAGDAPQQKSQPAADRSEAPAAPKSKTASTNTSTALPSPAAAAAAKLVSSQPNQSTQPPAPVGSATSAAVSGSASASKSGSSSTSKSATVVNGTVSKVTTTSVKPPSPATSEPAESASATASRPLSRSISAPATSGSSDQVSSPAPAPLSGLTPTVPSKLSSSRAPATASAFKSVPALGPSELPNGRVSATAQSQLPSDRVTASAPASRSGSATVLASVASTVKTSKAVPKTEPSLMSAPETRPASAAVSRPASSAPAVTQNSGTGTERQRQVTIDDDLSEAIRKIWPQTIAAAEPYRPSWAEPAHTSPTNDKPTCNGHTASGPDGVQTSAPGRKSNHATDVNDRPGGGPAIPCSCLSEPGKPCSCMNGTIVRSRLRTGGAVRAMFNGARSEDSAVDSMTDPTSSSTDGSVGGSAETSRPPKQSYAAIHLASPPAGKQTSTPPPPTRPPPSSSLTRRQHEFNTVRKEQTNGARPRLSRSASAGPGRPRSGGGGPTRPRTAASAERAASGGPTRPRTAVSADRATTRPAPVRNVASAPTLPRRQTSPQRSGQQSAPPGRPPRRRRTRSQDPALTFQQWLQQHERERAQAIQDRKNNARKRKQEAHIKQEKAPQAFRVWLRKKRQQQLMEQRVQQLRQHELLAAAAVTAPPGHHQHHHQQQQQQDAFRQWLVRKQRERLSSGLGPAQATLRSLSALYRVGRPASAARTPPLPPAAAGDRAATPHHAHLQHIYGPHVPRGRHRRRSMDLFGD